MTVDAILLQLAQPFPPFALLLILRQAVQLFGEQAIASFHLPQLELPTRASCRLELFENVVLRGQSCVLVADDESISTSLCDDALQRCVGVAGGLTTALRSGHGRTGLGSGGVALRLGARSGDRMASMAMSSHLGKSRLSHEKGGFFAVPRIARIQGSDGV